MIDRNGFITPDYYTDVVLPARQSNTAWNQCLKCEHYYYFSYPFLMGEIHEVYACDNAKKKSEQYVKECHLVNRSGRCKLFKAGKNKRSSK